MSERCCTPAWKWALCLLLLGAVIGAGIFAVQTYSRAAHRSEMSGVMTELFAAFQMYAAADAGNHYPPRSKVPGPFLPDLTAWAELGEGLAEFEEAYRAFEEDEDRSLCYLGYAFYDEASAHRVLDQLESDPNTFRGGGAQRGDISVLDPASPAFTELHPLRVGVEMTFVNAWYVFRGAPASPGELAHPIPILWQMPRGRGDRVAVLHLSGRVTFEDYPGNFPMSPLFVNRVRGLMGLPQEPGFTLATPIVSVVRDVLEAGSRDPGLDAGSLLHLDAQPTVLANDAEGYRIALTRAELVLLSEGAAVEELSASVLFKPVRGDYHGLPRGDAIRFMGTKRGYHWYGKMDYGVFVLLDEAFEFAGGESLYPAAAAYWLDRAPAQRWLQPANAGGKHPNEMLQRPTSLSSYVHVYMNQRSKSGKPIDVEVIHAAAILCGLDDESHGINTPPSPEIASEARTRLLDMAGHDAQAAVTLVLPYILPHRSRGPRTGPTEERRKLLERFPEDTVHSTLRHLADNLQDEHEAELCQNLLGRLIASSAN